MDPGTALYLITVSWALLIGGENLIRVTFHEIGLGNQYNRVYRWIFGGPEGDEE
ncbi:hypothetical protein [Candidatus Nanohalovita haloferacivicina]|uniref:hypothetical protein n=1 Tax=Candidatus Nanohalovita haloferacivicina TaxID=2978046 RepID=UPI00325FCC3E|nr:hypothetical protein HBNXNv_0343 [Candidatus Nanohalobia archaeon BNXNv]